MHKYVVAASVAAVALTVGACSSSSGKSAASSGGTKSAAASGKTGGTLSLGTIQAPAGFVPGDMNATGPTPQFYQPVYDTLVKLTTAANPIPDLATSFTYDSKLTTLSLKLRSGVTFTDGSAFNAAAVKANLDAAAKGTGESGGQLRSIASVTVADPTDVKIVLHAPDPSLLRNLGGAAGMMASPKALAAGSLKTTPVGSGPYVLDSGQTTAGSKYTYTRNAKYWGGTTSFPFDKIVETVFGDTSSELNALRAGQINGAVLVQKDVATAKGSGLTVATYPQYTSAGLYIFDRQGKVTPALGKLAVRQAINYAIDRAAFVKNTQGGTGVATDQLFNSDSTGYEPALNTKYAYNLTKAKQLMAQAGYAKGFTVTMPDSSPIYPQEQAALTEALKSINITVKYVPVNGQAFIGDLLGGKFSMTLFQLTVGSSWDAVTGALQPGSTWNAFHVADPTIDRLIGQAQAQTGAAQTATFKKLNEAVTDAAWFAIVNQPAQFYATTKGITVTPERYNAYPPIYNYSRS